MLGVPSLPSCAARLCLGDSVAMGFERMAAAPCDDRDGTDDD
jgi:hypothetical protein